MVVKVSASGIAGYALAGAARKVEAGWRNRNNLDKRPRQIKRRSRKRNRKVLDGNRDIARCRVLRQFLRPLN